MRILRCVLFLGLGCVASGQSKDKPKPAPTVLPLGVSVSDPIYPLPLAERDKIRDLQHANDQIEIENQKMLAKIEQNRGKQALLVEEMQLVATGYAQSRHVDIGQYELDPAQIRLVKKASK